jgi:hypothetical protein
MGMGLLEILIAAGTAIGTWILSNTKLKEGITDWFVSIIGNNAYDISNHNIHTTLRAIKFESKLISYDNKIKTELYYYYIETIIDSMENSIQNIFENHKKMNLHNTKVLIKNNMYDKLDLINKELLNNIRMPEQLQEKFNKLNNYLSKQHTYTINNVLQAHNKKILLIQTFNAIENNSRWFLFYTTEMFENFNGAFDNIKREDVFIH